MLGTILFQKCLDIYGVLKPIQMEAIQGNLISL